MTWHCEFTNAFTAKEGFPDGPPSMPQIDEFDMWDKDDAHQYRSQWNSTLYTWAKSVGILKGHFRMAAWREEGSCDVCD